MLQHVLDGIDRGDTAALARAISLVENQRDGFERVLSHAHARVGRHGSRRIGITGPPGAGKSTLTERLVQHYRAAGLTVAVVAVDPTSPYTGGALLGDRIRMESVSTDPGVFIRSMATRGSVGGLAQTTEEVADVLDAFGFARILIETVGVGQDEIDVVRSLPFSTDEFFAALRECYNRRSLDPRFQRLTFCLLGVASPSELIQDVRITPFNIGRRIELTDFTAVEAAPLAQGLVGPSPPAPTKTEQEQEQEQDRCRCGSRGGE